jgi:hypothetical protein
MCVCVCVCVMLLARSRYDKDLPFSRHAIRLRAFSSRPGFLLRGLSTLSLRVHIDAGICRWNVERCSFSVLYGRTMSVCHSDCVYRVCCRLPCTRPTVCRRVPSGGGSRRRRAVKSSWKRRRELSPTEVSFTVKVLRKEDNNRTGPHVHTRRHRMYVCMRMYAYVCMAICARPARSPCLAHCAMSLVGDGGRCPFTPLD